MKWRNWLDPDAKYWHRMWSTRLALLDAIFSGLWLALPAFQYLLPPVHFAVACVIMAILVFIGRIIDQPSIPRAGDPNV